MERQEIKCNACGKTDFKCCNPEGKTSWERRWHIPRGWCVTLDGWLCPTCASKQ